MSIGKPKIKELEPILLKISEKYNVDLITQIALKNLSLLMYKCDGEYYLFLSYLNSYFNSNCVDLSFLKEENFDKIVQINDEWIENGCTSNIMNLFEDFKTIISKKIILKY